jgi:hypothetical protein
MGDPQRRLTLTKQRCLGVARQPMKVPSKPVAKTKSLTRFTTDAWFQSPQSKAASGRGHLASVKETAPAWGS